MAVSSGSRQPTPTPTTRVRRYPPSASKTAPRWIPLRGQVLKRALKRVFASCLCCNHLPTSSRKTRRSISMVFP
ncbi:hypothetical protein GQ457_04G010100 [Hibiscus cannabinus]